MVVCSHSWHPRFLFNCAIDKITMFTWVYIKSWRRLLRFNIRFQWLIRSRRQICLYNLFWWRGFIHRSNSLFWIDASVVLFVVWSWFFSNYTSFIDVATSVGAIFETALESWFLRCVVFLICADIWEFVFLRLVYHLFSVGYSWWFRRHACISLLH